jgi:hypothetical protein
MGRLIPAGTGFDIYQHIRIPLDSPPPPPPSSPDDVDLERDIDYLADADDLLDRERGEILE